MNINQQDSPSIKQLVLKMVDKHKGGLLYKLDNLKSLDNDIFVKDIVKSQFYYMYQDFLKMFEALDENHYNK